MAAAQYVPIINPDMIFLGVAGISSRDSCIINPKNNRIMKNRMIPVKLCMKGTKYIKENSRSAVANKTIHLIVLDFVIMQRK